MKILIINENIRDLMGNDSFWCILKDNLPNAEAIGLLETKGVVDDYLRNYKPQIIISNSILGPIKTPFGCRKVVFIQDNYLGMSIFANKNFKHHIKKIIKKILGKGDFYQQRIAAQKLAIKEADKIVCVSKDTANYYKPDAEIIQMGIDPKIFKPMNKIILRDKYNIPRDKFVKIFVGSTHWVKGFDILKKEIKKDKDSFWVIVLKDKKTCKFFLNYTQVKLFQRIPHKILAELYNCADLYVGRSRIETFWQTAVEAMFCNVPVDITSVGIFADWQPENKNPRQEAFQKGLDRETMIRKWQELIVELS